MRMSEVLTIVTNGDRQVYEQLAVLKDFPLQVNFQTDSLANIISLYVMSRISLVL